MIKSGLKPVDFIIIAFSIVFIVFIAINIYADNTGSAVLKITSADAEYLYPLEKDSEIDVEGPIGHTHVVIMNGEAYISESPCDNKQCILMGSISKQGQWAACMPNRVFISIEGGSDDEEIDVLSY